MQPNPPNDTFDPNLVNAINGGNPPDVAMPFGPDYVGQWCAGGLWQDLAPYMKADGMSINDFAPAAITYTNSSGKQCALPSLTDAFGLYYNKDMFAKAGIAGPPKTMDELMADAKKLTVRNPDGTIKVAGFVPLNQWEELGPGDLANAWGAKWFDSSGKPQLAEDPGWAAAFMLAAPADRLVRLRQHHQVLRRQHEQRVQSQQRVRERQGGDDVRRRVANGVHQARQASNLQLRHRAVPGDASTIPTSTAPSRVGGTIVGIPKGAKHPDQAWLLVKYLASDTNYLVQMANSGRQRADHARLRRVSGPDAAAPVRHVPAGLGQSEVGLRAATAGRRAADTPTCWTTFEDDMAVRQDP